jgi:hypothetical protein
MEVGEGEFCAQLGAAAAATDASSSKSGASFLILGEGTGIWMTVALGVAMRKTFAEMGTCENAPEPLRASDAGVEGAKK